MRQNNQLERNLGTGAKGEERRSASDRSACGKTCLERPAVAGPSMEAVVVRESLKKALARVKSNKSAAGTDGIRGGYRRN
jgi:RNA-directed DNA polymerase